MTGATVRGSGSRNTHGTVAAARTLDDVPVRPRIERARDGNRSDVGSVHQPDRRRAVGPLPQDVGSAIAVDIAGAPDLPARPRIEGAHGTDEGRSGAVHQPDRGCAVAALPQDVGAAVA